MNRSNIFIIAAIIIFGCTKGEDPCLISHSELNRKGDTLRFCFYDKSKMNGVVRKTNRGLVFSEAPIRNGKIDGQSIGYHEDGSIKYYATFENGNVWGPYIEFDTNGTIVMVAEHKTSNTYLGDVYYYTDANLSVYEFYDEASDLVQGVIYDSLNIYSFDDPFYVDYIYTNTPLISFNTIVVSAPNIPGVNDTMILKEIYSDIDYTYVGDAMVFRIPKGLNADSLFTIRYEIKDTDWFDGYDESTFRKRKVY